MIFQREVEQKTRRGLAAIAAASVLGLVLSGCAGSVGNEANSGGGLGVPVGASDAEYQEALADMPETTLVYQPEAPSAQVISAPRALKFKERVEEASGGKIKIKIVWGQAIADYSEVVDALVDGRVDIATTVPIYNPAEFPVNDAFIAASTLGGSSPRAGELASNAALLEAAWNSEEYLAELESHGLVPLIPFYGDGNQMAMCTERLPAGTGWRGLQTGVGSSIQRDQVSKLTASPVSLQYTEIYEALQRNSIDCTLAHGAAATGTGFLEVAHHFIYSDEVSFGRNAQSVVAGTKFKNLPLAAQQLVFDEMVTLFEQQLTTSLAGNFNVSAAITQRNGSSQTLTEKEVQELKQLSEELLAQKVGSGVIPDGFVDNLNQKYDKWDAIVEEMGLADEGDLESFSEWHDPESDKIREFAERFYDEVMLEHRPK